MKKICTQASPSAARHGQHIRIQVIGGEDDLLPLDDGLDGFELVAQGGGFLEAHFFRCFLHLALAGAATMLFAVSAEEIHQVGDHLAVLGLGRRADAGRDTQLDVIVKTGAFVLPGDLAVTGQIGEDAAQHIQGLIDRPGGGVRTKITRAIFDHLPRDGDFGEWLVPVDLDVRIALVILEADVVFRAMLLDQVHLKDERLKLRADHDPFNIHDLAHEAAGLGIVAGIRVEVGADAVLQADGLADINDRARRVLHQVTARLGRQGFQDPIEVFRYDHLCYFTSFPMQPGKPAGNEVIFHLTFGCFPHKMILPTQANINQERNMNELPNMPVTPAAPESVFQNWIRALTRPTEENFASMATSPRAKASTGYLWYFIASIVQVLLASIVQGTITQNPIFQNYFPGIADQYTNMGSPLLRILCGAPIGAVVSTIFFAIGTAIVQWIARMFGGTGTNDKLVYVLSNILTPYLMISGLFTLLSAIPYVGLCFSGLVLAGGIYILVLEVMAVKAVNRFGWGQAIASLLIPGLVIAFFCACVVGGLFALLAPIIRDNYQQLQQSLPQ